MAYLDWRGVPPPAASYLTMPQLRLEVSDRLRAWGSPCRRILSLLAVLSGLLLPGENVLAAGVRLVSLFEKVPTEGPEDTRYKFHYGRLGAAQDEGSLVRTELVDRSGHAVELELSPFTVLTPDVRLFMGDQAVPAAPIVAQVSLWRGRVVGSAARVFLSYTEFGMINGVVAFQDGRSWYLTGSGGSPGEWSHVEIREAGALDPPSPFADFCGVVATEAAPAVEGRAVLEDTAAGPRLAHVALDSDELFFGLFGNSTAAYAYMIQLLGAVSDLYEHDVDLRLVVDYMRLWPTGGEPFSADDLGSLSSHWEFNEDLTGLNYVHLLSGRRDLPYGGVAYLASVCGGAFGISGFLNGSFSDPAAGSSLGTWDLIVVAHEMGHNTGTLHTHDGYAPVIDNCGNGAPARGTIMSYCHTHPGYTTNIDLRFHARVEAVMESETRSGGCLAFDCNGNAVDDTTDIRLGQSADTNGDDLPDECQDCNQNGQLDPAEIALGAQDVNDNGILDACEDDCNGNGTPDTWETALGLAPDENGNHLPDLCDPDCNENGEPDFADIASGTSTDYDRNTVPDECQDCNANSVPDWIDLGRPYNVLVVDRGDEAIREYHGQSGVPVHSYTGLSMPYDCVFGADRKLYTAGFGDSRIWRTDLQVDLTLPFVGVGSGGLSSPTSLVFGPNGNLFVSSSANHRVLEYNGTTGAFVRVFVAAGAGGLNTPYGLTFGPDGDLYVASSNHAVLRYDGTTGVSKGAFVTPGSGGLSGPRGLAFKSNGQLLVTSFNTNQVLEYSSSGAFLRVFNDLVEPTRPWGIRVGPNGNVFVARSQGTIRLLEYLPESGRYYRAIVRNDPLLVSPSGFDFMPGSLEDCNGNGVLDSCDINSGFSADLNANGTPDECESCHDSDGDGLGDPGLTFGLCPEDNCPYVFNSDQADSDADGHGDSCDACAGFPDTQDADLDGTPDLCDLCAGWSDSADADADGVPDGCDACAGSPDNSDGDSDQVPDACDACPGFDDAQDADLDGVPDACDACVLGPDSLDSDHDQVADACDRCPGVDDSLDGDLDLAPDPCDNCPNLANPTQANFDGDALGDACDSCPALVVPNGESLLPGDVNASDAVTSADIIYMVNHVFKAQAAPLPIPEVGDVDCSGQLTSADIIRLVNFVFKSGPPPCNMCAVP